MDGGAWAKEALGCWRIIPIDRVIKVMRPCLCQSSSFGEKQFQRVFRFVPCNPVTAQYQEDLDRYEGALLMFQMRKNLRFRIEACPAYHPDDSLDSGELGVIAADASDSLKFRSPMGH